MSCDIFISKLIQFAENNKISLDDLHVSHGGSMLMLGLINSTRDIDVTVKPEIFANFEKKGFYKKPIGNNRYLMSITPEIDIHLDDNPDCWMDLVQHHSGIKYRNAVATLKDYRKMNRPKDQERILILERHLSGCAAQEKLVKLPIDKDGKLASLLIDEEPVNSWRTQLLNEAELNKPKVIVVKNGQLLDLEDKPIELIDGVYEVQLKIYSIESLGPQPGIFRSKVK